MAGFCQFEWYPVVVRLFREEFKMTKILKKSLLALCVVTLASGCAYGSIAALGGKYVVVTVNDSFLFGALKKVYVCQATPTGLTNCAAHDSP